MGKKSTFTPFASTLSPIQHSYQKGHLFHETHLSHWLRLEKADIYKKCLSYILVYQFYLQMWKTSLQV